MLLLVANVYDVPELNLGRYFYLHTDDGGSDDGERQRLQSPSDVDRQPPRYTSTDPATSSSKAEQDGGGGSSSKRSKKPEDKKRLTDESGQETTDR